MAIVSDFFRYARVNHVLVAPYRNDISAGITMRINGRYGVFLDFEQLDTACRLNTVLGHECAHLKTGALHKVDSPFELEARSEYKARRCFTEEYLPFEKLALAMKNGYTQPWQLSELFEVEEDAVRWALDYYVNRRGLSFGA